MAVRTFACPFCGESTDNKESIDMHISTEPAAEPGKVYSDEELKAAAAEVAKAEAAAAEHPR